MSPGARGRPHPPQTSPPPRARVGRVVGWGSRWEAGPAPPADGRERPRDWREAGAEQVLLLRREGAGGAAAAGRRTRREGPALRERGVLPTALPRARAATPNRLPVRAARGRPGRGAGGARLGRSDSGRWGTALRESARSGNTLMVPGGEFGIIPGTPRRRVAAGAGPRRGPGGARFLSVPLARPRPSGSGMGGGVFRPFLSQKLFLLQPARDQ